MSRVVASDSGGPDIMLLVGKIMRVLGPLTAAQRARVLRALLALVEEGAGG